MNDKMYCSFCGASNKEVAKLIAEQGGVKICNKCVTSCVQILGEGKSNECAELEDLLKEIFKDITKDNRLSPDTFDKLIEVVK